MRTDVFRCAVVVAVLALVGLPESPAQAQFVINATFDSSITSDPNAAAIEGVINNAISFYQSTLTDPIHVAITFQKGGGLGSSSTYFGILPYQTFINALTADKKSANDSTALAHLPTGATNPVTSSSSIAVKTANLRALGINATPPVGQPDGFITLNTLLTDVGSPGTTGQFSLLAVTEHEMDEVLGLGSALPSPPNDSPFPEDLYRYDSSGVRNFTTNPNAHAFFSIDGTTLIDEFNQNGVGDFGDWVVHNPAQVQDWAGTVGAHPLLTAVSPEVEALDVIGYDLRGGANVVPVPSAFLSFGLGLSALSAALCRRRRRSDAGRTIAHA